ncbi:MAG: oligoendopeptidase F [Lachnospiraceae bacterium]|nr:oligoendopeptidase F [Lachnospiraceae bacterium]
MAEELKERKEMDPAFFWDLSSLFADDAAWEKAFATLEEDIASLKSYEGTLTDAATIRKYLDHVTEVRSRVSDLYVYAFQRKDEDLREDQAQSMYARISTGYAALFAADAFAEPEILALPEETLRSIVGDELIQPYAFYMENLVRGKAHTLSGREETLLASLTESRDAPGEIARMLEDADLLFADAADENGAMQQVSGASFVKQQTSHDRTLRKNVYESYYKTFREHINTFATAYSYHVKNACSMAKIRKYASSLEDGMFADNVPVTVYRNLIETVRRHTPDLQRYVRLRKKLLGVDELHFYDIYAPLVASFDKEYTYEQAQKTVLDAVSVLGDEYRGTVEGAFRDGWIDVYPNKGKRSGAYSSGSYRSYPYILLNFRGNYSSVTTIAHEMGHSMHSYLARRTQPAHYAGYSIFVAEVASTVNENLLVEQLLKQTSDEKERMFLLNQYLEGFKGTLFRQTLFAEFEMRAHAMHEAGEALSVSALDGLYKELLIDYYGEDIVIDDEIIHEWARIPHFYRKFYVYKYATGYSAAVALSEAILAEGDSAVKPYLEFLSLGGSVYPIDALKHAGVDLTTPDPVERALDKFARVLDDAERVSGSGAG